MSRLSGDKLHKVKILKLDSAIIFILRTGATTGFSIVSPDFIFLDSGEIIIMQNLLKNKTKKTKKSLRVPFFFKNGFSCQIDHFTSSFKKIFLFVRDIDEL